jgi:hypothetical protein
MKFPDFGLFGGWTFIEGDPAVYDFRGFILPGTPKNCELNIELTKLPRVSSESVGYVKPSPSRRSGVPIPEINLARFRFLLSLN